MRLYEQNVRRVMNLINFGFADLEIADKLRETDDLEDGEIFLTLKGAKLMLKYLEEM